MSHPLNTHLETIYNLLPAIYRVRDAEQGGPLRELLEVIAGQVSVLQENLDQLYDDQFIETCAEWVVPYIGDLIGARSVYGLSRTTFSLRAQVANTLAYRRRKGTASVLEQLARDVTNQEARAVEFFQLLNTTQQVNHLRMDIPATPNLRQVSWLEHVNGPFERAAHSAALRSVARLGGRYNIPNFGIFLWRIQAFPITGASAAGMGDGFRFFFNPLGADTQLFNLPQTEAGITHLAEPINAPLPISRLALKEDLEAYYGRGKSLWISLDFGEEDGVEDVPAEEVVVCDLSDRPDSSWGPRPEDKYAIDPVLGRLLVPTNAGTFEELRTSYHYGFSAMLGGGEYNRSASLGACQKTGLPPPPVQTITRKSGSLQAALDAVVGGGVVEVADSATYTGGLRLDVDPGACVEVRAVDGARPVLVLESSGGEASGLTITGGEGAEVTLNGFVISGGVVQVPDASGSALRRLRLRHCTLVPGLTLDELGEPGSPGEAGMVVELVKVEIEIEDCIIGALRVVEDSETSLVNTIMDANSESGVAYAAPDGTSAGGPLFIESCTIIGKVHTLWIDLASNAIFYASTEEGDEDWPSKAPVLAQRLQQGCVRYSFLPADSHVPRRFACQPQPGNEDRVRPLFTSRYYGDPGYAQLSQNCAVEIRTGAEDGAEMGALNQLKQPQREANLRIRLEEFLPFRLEAGVLYAS